MDWVAIAIISIPVTLILARLIRYVATRGSDTLLLAAFMDDTRLRGLTFDEAMDELEIRRAIAKLRVIASERVRKNPLDYMGIILECKKDTISEMHKGFPHLTEHLATILAHLPYNHVLLPDVSSRVDRLVKAEAHLCYERGFGALSEVDRMALRETKNPRL